MHAPATAACGARRHRQQGKQPHRPQAPSAHSPGSYNCKTKGVPSYCSGTGLHSPLPPSPTSFTKTHHTNLPPAHGIFQPHALNPFLQAHTWPHGPSSKLYHGLTDQGRPAPRAARHMCYRTCSTRMPRLVGPYKYIPGAAHQHHRQAPTARPHHLHPPGNY